jgi:hypothetical protein
MEAPELVEGSDLFGHTAVYTKDGFVNAGGDGKPVENLVDVGEHGKGFVFREDFFEEAVCAIDFRVFVVTAKEEDVRGVEDEKAEEECDHFGGVFAAVNIVAKKQKARLRRNSDELEDADEIDEVAMNIADDVHWTSDVKNSCDFGEVCLGCLAKGSDDVGGERRDRDRTAKILA